MMFCPKCKSIMMPKTDKGKKQLVCGCGYKHETAAITITESAKKKGPALAVADEQTSIDVVIDIICPKCENGKAEYWEIQTRAADEPPTRFHKCTKCKHTWRERT